MLTGILYELTLHSPHYIPESLSTLIVKFPCSAALHMLLSPQVAQGMAIMKYANNQPQEFVNEGSQIAFVLGFLQYTASIYC